MLNNRSPSFMYVVIFKYKKKSNVYGNLYGSSLDHDRVRLIERSTPWGINRAKKAISL